MISYYSQSIRGQLSILYNQEDIDSVISSPHTSEKLKNKLIVAKSIRHYASNTLKLPSNDSYLSYADLKRPYVVWNVFATPEFSLTPVNWCYPIVGCVSYRGYFEEERAKTFSDQLTLEGKDSYVGGVPAYSTLGWFDDPLLNTMINWRQRSLAGLIFHELTHQVIYIPNETSFNEALASAVERMGTVQWLIEHRQEQVHEYLDYLSAQSDFRILLLETRSTLAKIYDSEAGETEKRNAKKSAITKMEVNYEEMKNNWPASIHFDAWFNEPINNARLSSSMTYLQKIPAFYAIFIEKGANWQIFLQYIQTLESLSKSERETLINKKLTLATKIQSVAKMLKK